MYILFLPRIGLYISFLPLANARGKTSLNKGLPVASMNYFLIEQPLKNHASVILLSSIKVGYIVICGKDFF
jgi:hypothetical protein